MSRHQVLGWNDFPFVQGDGLPTLLVRTVHGQLAEFDLVIFRFGVPLVKPVRDESLAPRTRGKMRHHDPGVFSVRSQSALRRAAPAPFGTVSRKFIAEYPIRPYSGWRLLSIPGTCIAEVPMTPHGRRRSYHKTRPSRTRTAKLKVTRSVPLHRRSGATANIGVGLRADFGHDNWQAGREYRKRKAGSTEAQHVVTLHDDLLR